MNNFILELQIKTNIYLIKSQELTMTQYNSQILYVITQFNFIKKNFLK